MMRVGILTIYKSNNYGSVLQAYALQSVVNKLGSRGEIIDHSIPDGKPPHLPCSTCGSDVDVLEVRAPIRVYRRSGDPFGMTSGITVVGGVI